MFVLLVNQQTKDISKHMNNSIKCNKTHLINTLITVVAVSFKQARSKEVQRSNCTPIEKKYHYCTPTKVQGATVNVVIM